MTRISKTFAGDGAEHDPGARARARRWPRARRRPPAPARPRLRRRRAQPRGSPDRAARARARGAACGPVLHAFLDGRDTPPRSARSATSRACCRTSRPRGGCVATVIGRYWAMDRDNRWERVGARLPRDRVPARASPRRDALAAVEAAYARDESDEFVQPTRDRRRRRARGRRRRALLQLPRRPRARAHERAHERAARALRRPARAASRSCGPGSSSA